MKANTVPKGFTCSRVGDHDATCHCWNTAGKHGESQSDCNEPKQCLIYKATSAGDFKFDSFANSSSLGDKLGAWNVPKELVAEYQMAALTSSADFKTFDFTVGSKPGPNGTKVPVGQFVAHVGSLRNYNGTIYVGYIYGAANGTLIQPYVRTAAPGHCNIFDKGVH